MPTQTPTTRILWVRNQYDTSPPLQIQLTDNEGAPFDLAEAESVTVDIAWAAGDHHYSPYRRLITDGPCTIGEGDGLVWYILQPGDTDVVGLFHVKFTIHWESGEQQTVPVDYPLAMRVHPQDRGTEVTATVGQLVDATFRTWLEPPDYQPPIAILGESMNEVIGELKIGDFALAEDEQLIRVGVLLELGSELVRVMSYDAVTFTATVRRGELGTQPVSHASPAAVKISPPYPRLDVFRSVAHNIGTLSPSLFTVDVKRMVETSPGVAPLDDPLAVSIIEIIRETRDLMPVNSFDLVDFHPQTQTRSVLVPQGIGDFWVRYRRRVATPTSETATLAELGMEEMWATAVIAGAAGEIMMGADVPRTTTEWVGQVLESSGVSVGKRQEVGFGLIQYREMLIERYRKEMTQEYRTISAVRMSPYVSAEGSIL